MRYLTGEELNELAKKYNTDKVSLISNNGLLYEDEDVVVHSYNDYNASGNTGYESTHIITINKDTNEVEHNYIATDE